MGIFVIPGICLIIIYGSQTTAFFLYFSASRGMIYTLFDIFFYFKGPCKENELFIFKDDNSYGICQEKICPDGEVEYGGKCAKIGSHRVCNKRYTYLTKGIDGKGV